MEASLVSDEFPFRILGISSTSCSLLRPEMERPTARPISRTGLDLDLGGRVGDTSGEPDITDDLKIFFIFEQIHARKN